MKPGEREIILIQQVGGGMFSITGGEGSYYLEEDKILAGQGDKIEYFIWKSMIAALTDIDNPSFNLLISYCEILTKRLTQ